MTTPKVMADPAAAVPVLQAGERMTRAEFERRYEAMPDLKKAELIEGVVSMPSPVRLEQHGSPHFDLVTWLGVYRANTPGVRGGDNSTIRLDMENEPQPDSLLLIEPSLGGQARIDTDGYLEGGPELVAEVAASSLQVDLTTRLQIYQRNHVREYLVWRVLERALDWFVLRQGQYEMLVETAGIFRSEVFPGLWLHMNALIGGDLAGVLRNLQNGLASPDHAAFVGQLQQRVAGRP
jgi:Putative restriction endonuclease